LIDVNKLNTILKEDKVKVSDFQKSEAYKSGPILNALNIWRSDTYVENYDGSWSELNYLDHLPIEIDSVMRVLN
jgi:hypothetical protein